MNLIWNNQIIIIIILTNLIIIKLYVVPGIKFLISKTNRNSKEDINNTYVKYFKKLIRIQIYELNILNINNICCSCILKIEFTVYTIPFPF